MGKIFLYSMLILLVISIASVYLGYYKLAYVTGFLFGLFALGCVGLNIPSKNNKKFNSDYQKK